MQQGRQDQRSRCQLVRLLALVLVGGLLGWASVGYCTGPTFANPKVEELTLYTIEQHKVQQTLLKQNAELQRQNTALAQRLTTLEQQFQAAVR